MKFIIVYLPNEQAEEHQNEWRVEHFDTIEQAFIRSVELKKEHQKHKVGQVVELSVELT